ncbi:MAG: hypothetical protein RLY70_1631 [Planctomycetota bacterium]
MSRFVTSRAVWAVAMMIRGLTRMKAMTATAMTVTAMTVTAMTAIATRVIAVTVIAMAVTTAPANERRLSGVSSWEPDRELAVREAELRAMEAVRAWLENTLGTAPSGAQLVRWLEHPEVVRRETVERRERAYGEMSRATVSFTIRSETWESWRLELARTAADRRRWRVARVLSTLLIALAAVIGTRLWDNRTQGYDRWRIGIISLPLFAAVNAAIWMI